jgi:glutaredoxin
MADTAHTPLPIGHELTEGEPHHAVTVYGTPFCHDTRRARALLDDLGVEYNFYDTEKDAAIARTAWSLQNGGQKVPVIDLHDGTVLVEPANDALLEALTASGRLHPVAPTEV